MSKEPIRDLPINSVIDPENPAELEPDEGVQIPEGSRVATIIVDKGEVVEKIYQTPDGVRTSVKFWQQSPSHNLTAVQRNTCIINIQNQKYHRELFVNNNSIDQISRAWNRCQSKFLATQNNICTIVNSTMNLVSRIFSAQANQFNYISLLRFQGQLPAS